MDVEPAVDVMKQAAAVAEQIDVLYGPRFFACKKDVNGDYQHHYPIDLLYDSPRRPGPRCSFVPRDWRYLVIATTQVPTLHIESCSICGPLDIPDRKLGRAMSLMRLAGVLASQKYEVWAEGKNRAIQIPPLVE